MHSTYPDLPVDLRVWRTFFRVAPRGYGLARKLWLPRLRALKAVCFRTRWGFAIVVDPTDYHGWSIAMHGEHEPGVTAWILRQLRPGDTFVDVGANHGWFALLAAHRLHMNPKPTFAPCLGGVSKSTVSTT